ncbi:MAG: hypothetical protein ACP5KN_01145 [Armatimonadota bacterium]
MRSLQSRPSLPYERLTTARAWRIVIYAIAALLTFLVAGLAVHLARPPNTQAQIRVETPPGLGNAWQSRTERVEWDSRTGRTTIDVRMLDGTLKRYYLTDAQHGIELSENEEAPPARP